MHANLVLYQLNQAKCDIYQALWTTEAYAALYMVVDFLYDYFHIQIVPQT